MHTAGKALLNPGVGRLLTLGLYIIIGKRKPKSYTLARPGCRVGVSHVRLSRIKIFL